MERDASIVRLIWLCVILSVLVTVTLMQGCAVAAGAAAGAGAGYVAGHEAREEAAEEELGVDMKRTNVRRSFAACAARFWRFDVAPIASEVAAGLAIRIKIKQFTAAARGD